MDVLNKKGRIYMKQSRFLCLLMCLVLFFCLIIPSHALQNQLISVTPINVMVGGKVFLPTDANGNDVPVFVYNGTTYAPLRALAEAYGLTVGYNAEKKLATVTGTPSANFAGSKGTKQALTEPTSLSVAPINIEVNGVVFQPKDANGNPVSVFVYNGTTYAPLRALAEAYGLTVGYNAEKKLATVDFTGTSSKPSGTSDGVVQVAKALKTPSIRAAEFPDLSFYVGDRLKFSRSEQDKENTISAEFQGQLDDYKVLEYYVYFLTGEYDFKLVETPYYKQYKKSGGTETYFDFLLKYTGSEKLTGDQAEGFSGAKGDVRIYGVASYSSVKGAFIYNDSLSAVDDDNRYGAASIGFSYAGTSSCAALNRLSNGTYQTADDRLSAAVGQASVVSDGTLKTYTARYEEVPNERRSVFVEDANGNVILQLRFKNALKENTVYYANALANENPFMLDDGSHENNQPLSTTSFYVLHNGRYYSAVPGMTGEIRRANLRVMYVGENNEMVLHVGVWYAHTPNVEDYLIAVSTDPETSSSGGSTSGSGSSGGVPSVNTQGTTPRLKCTFSGCDDGEIECSVCDGEGGWREYDTSTPGYGTNPDRWEWKRCSNCGGDGEVACRRCGGDGWMD